MKSRRIAVVGVKIYLVLIAAAHAQMPRTISYQGVLARTDGTLLPDGSHTLTLALYQSPAGGSPVFTETQTVTAVRGMFNVIIGSGTGSGLPESLAFDRAYFLGVSVDGSSELTPRTPLTAVPYALHATVAEHATSATRADSAMTLMGGAVTSLNGMQGALKIKGDGATTVSIGVGNEMIISSKTGSGIEELMGSDGTIGIVNATGPVSDLQVLEGGIRTSKIQDWAVTNEKLAPNAVDAVKINTRGAQRGQALISDGTQTPFWGDPIGFNLPYSAMLDAPRPILSLTNSGDGSAAEFVTSKEQAYYPAVMAKSNGAGSAIIAYRNSTTGTLPTISGLSYSNDDYAPAITGAILSTNPGVGSTGVLGSINYSGANGSGVWGRHDGGGIGVMGTSASGTGVRASSTSGYGIYATSSKSVGGFFGTSDSNSAAILATNLSGRGAAIISSGHAIPNQSNAYDLGTQSNQWRTVNASSASLGTINAGAISAVTIGAGTINTQTINAQTITTGTINAQTISGNGTIPVGGIIMWSGAISQIPTGWALCNGLNNTPDLQGRFVRGAGSSTYPVGSTGGAAVHSHTVDAHTHSINHNHPSISTSWDGAHHHSHQYMTENGGNDMLGGTLLFGFNITSEDAGGHSHSVDIPNYTGTSGSASPGTSSASNLPPYYALAFIMRIQ